MDQFYKIIDVESVLGPVNMDYDEDLVSFEASKRYFFNYKVKSPVDIEKDVDNFLKEALERIK